MPAAKKPPRNHKALDCTYGCSLTFSVIMALFYFYNWMNARNEGESYKCLMMNYETKRFDNVGPKWKLVLLLGWINYLILTLAHRMSFDVEPLTSCRRSSKYNFIPYISLCIFFLIPVFQ